jgi:hypothetical protein
MKYDFKHFLFFIFFVLVACQLKAADTLYFVGNMKISKSTSYKYNLRFVIDKENKVVGYSLSDPGGKNETKTKITGTFDSVKLTLTFEEKNVLRSKVDMKKSDLCFVKATLKFKKTKLIEQLSGSFSAYELGKSEVCAKGQIKLINTNTIKPLLKKMNDVKDDNEEEVDLSIYKEKVTKISDDKGAEFLVTGKKVKISIWDNGQVDGDVVTIYLNGKIILENYTVKTIAKVIDIVLQDGNEKDVIKIVALNEGTLPPNTAAIKIETSTEDYPILTQAKLNEVRVIYLKKK